MLSGVSSRGRWYYEQQLRVLSLQIIPSFLARENNRREKAINLNRIGVLVDFIFMMEQSASHIRLSIGLLKFSPRYHLAGTLVSSL